MPFGRSPGDDESPDPTTFATFEGGSAGCDEQSEGHESTTGLSVDTLATGVFPATTGAEVVPGCGNPDELCGKVEADKEG